MEKKNLKWYEAPQVEIVEMELQGILCVSGADSGNVGSEIPDEE